MAFDSTLAQHLTCLLQSIWGFLLHPSLTDLILIEGKSFTANANLDTPKMKADT